MKLVVSLFLVCCLFGFSQALVCSDVQTKAMGSDRQEICVDNVIANCNLYNKDDPTKCSKCRTGATLTGESPNITVCDCGSNTFLDGVDETMNPICAPAEIPNCYYYSSDDLNNCNQCVENATPNGPPITQCDCGDKDTIVEFRTAKVCIVGSTQIENCNQFPAGGDGTKCQTCYENSTPQGVMPHFTECDCTGKIPVYFPATMEGSCLDNIIDNCETYNRLTTKCEKCMPGTDTQGEAESYTECACANTSTILKGEEDQDVCIAENGVIEGCLKYNSEDVTKCWTCAPTYIPAAGQSSPTISSCVCPENWTEVKDNEGTKICVENVIDDCKAYNKENHQQCHTCFAGYEATGESPAITLCGCTGEKVESTDINSDPVCVTEVDECEDYNILATGCENCKDTFTGEGTVGAFTGCICGESQFKVLQQNYQAKCADEQIENCKLYKNGDLSVCSTCQDNAIPSGGIFMAYPTCTICEKIVAQAQGGSLVCVDGIVGCDRYDDTDSTLCYSCASGFTGNGVFNDSTECVCDGHPGMSNIGEWMCIAEEIENCVFYDGSGSGSCNECLEGIDGTGPEFLYTACPCTNVVSKANNAKICANTPIEFCNTYLSPLTCDVCAEGFTKADDDITCDCTEANKQKTVDGADICVTTVITKCTKYESLTTCGECEAGTTANADKTLCEEPAAPEDPASGSLIGFSMVLVTLLAMIIA